MIDGWQSIIYIQFHSFQLSGCLTFVSDDDDFDYLFSLLDLPLSVIYHSVPVVFICIIRK